jgi:hypothetical protein
MDGLFYSLVLWVYCAVSVGVLGALVVLVTWKRRRKYIAVTLLFLAVGLLVAGLRYFFAPPQMDAGYPFLHAQPDEAELAGKYVLNPAAVERLRQERMGNPETSLQLNADHTFTATNMLTEWLWLAEQGPRPISGSGDWKVEQVSGNPAWLVMCTFKAGESEGTHGRRSWGLDIAAYTEPRPQYALGIALQNGDAGYLMLVREGTSR